MRLLSFMDDSEMARNVEAPITLCSDGANAPHVYYIWLSGFSVAYVTLSKGSLETRPF
jgi:hypothetical protein